VRFWKRWICRRSTARLRGVVGRRGRRGCSGRGQSLEMLVLEDAAERGDGAVPGRKVPVMGRSLGTVIPTAGKVRMNASR
jgi:hypothetical protein